MYKIKIPKQILYPIIGLGFCLSSCSNVEPILNNQGKAEDLNGDSIPELLDKKTQKIYYSNKKWNPSPPDSSIVKSLIINGIEYNLMKGELK